MIIKYSIGVWIFAIISCLLGALVWSLFWGMLFSFAGNIFGAVFGLYGVYYLGNYEQLINSLFKDSES